jgi:hypothetical protein
VTTIQVPDIYDSAKYDAIHNGHLALAPLNVGLQFVIGWLLRSVPLG